MVYHLELGDAYADDILSHPLGLHSCTGLEIQCICPQSTTFPQGAAVLLFLQQISGKGHAPGECSSVLAFSFSALASAIVSYAGFRSISAKGSRVRHCLPRKRWAGLEPRPSVGVLHSWYSDCIVSSHLLNKRLIALTAFSARPYDCGYSVWMTSHVGNPTC